MVTVKPQGWVHASLKMACLRSAVRHWSQLDNQMIENERSAIRQVQNSKRTIMPRCRAEALKNPSARGPEGSERFLSRMKTVRFGTPMDGKFD